MTIPRKARRIAAPAFHRPFPQLPLDLGVADDDEAPILGILARGGADRRIEELEEDRIGHAIWLEAPESTGGVYLSLIHI